MNGMSTETVRVLTEVGEERLRQITKGYTPDHDRQHGAPHILRQVHSRMERLDSEIMSHAEARALVLQIAGLAVATIEQIDEDIEREKQEAITRRAHAVFDILQRPRIDEPLAVDVLKAIKERQRAQAEHTVDRLLTQALITRAEGREQTGPERIREATRTDRGGDAPQSPQAFA